jgi:hypothetical protein
LSTDARVRARIQQACDERPFASVDGFEGRTGTRLVTLGATRVE